MKKLDSLIIGVIVIWVSTPFAVYFLFDNWPERGQFGDVFGAPNALFSGLAFIGLMYTIWLQRTELELQREELKLQREEMIASRGELAQQVVAQRGLFHATTAQIAVAAAQAEIEALKMDSEPLLDTKKREAINRIREISITLLTLSDQIKNTQESG